VRARREPVEMRTTNRYSVSESSRETRAFNSAMARESSGKHPHLVPIPADKTRLGCASLARDFIWSTSTTLDICSGADCIPPGHHSVGSLTLPYETCTQRNHSPVVPSSWPQVCRVLDAEHEVPVTAGDSAIPPVIFGNYSPSSYSVRQSAT
jgi:hypothetical protein